MINYNIQVIYEIYSKLYPLIKDLNKDINNCI